jgi:hypothetical protein
MLSTRSYMTHSINSGQAETKSCQNCKQNFTIEPEDFDFYKKINISPPTWCPRCRNIRRYAWREDHMLYRDTCKMCGKNTISTYAPGGPFTIYCRDCWISDKWDPMNYGREYDFSKPFFQQFRELMRVVPRPALTGHGLVNSDYSHASISCKDCYFTFWSYFSEKSQYSYALLFSKDIFDSYVVDNSDHVYEGLHCNRLFQGRFMYYAEDSIDSAMLFDCLGCTSCFGCVNLRKQKYVLFNEQLTKEQYQEKIKYWDLGSYMRLQEAYAKFRELIRVLPRRHAFITNGIDVVGDIIRDTKNCKVCFSTLDGVQNCKYVYLGGLNMKDSYDVSGSGDLAELLCEIVGGTQLQNCQFGSGGTNSRNVLYSEWARNSAELFGCIGLKNKKYCILNKQYTKEQYRELLPKIKAQMDAVPYTDNKGLVYKFGEFFPIELSAFAYNETLAFAWYPLTKEQVIEKGMQWREPVARNYQITLPAARLPDHIRDAQDSILEETIGCLHEGTCNQQCAIAFRLTPIELAFYRKMNIALPRLCPNCRQADRLKWRNGFTLYERQCMCGGKNVYQNTSQHAHGEKPCQNNFSTTYAPERPETVYCDQCYKAEFL